MMEFHLNVRFIETWRFEKSFALLSIAYDIFHTILQPKKYFYRH